MARKPKDEAAKTRHALLDAAEGVFFKNGVARTSLQEVAEAAGVTRGAIYWHFKNKIELLAAMVDRVVIPHEDILEQLAVSGTQTPLQDLHRACRDSLHLMLNDPQRRRVLSIMMMRCEYIEEMTPIMAHHNECRERMFNRCLRLFEQAQKRGHLAPIWPPRAAAFTFQNLLMGLIWGGLKSEQSKSLDKKNNEGLKAFFASLCASGKI